MDEKEFNRMKKAYFKQRGVEVSDKICGQCKKTTTQVEILVQQINTGDPNLDILVRKYLVDVIPALIHEYFGLKPPDPCYIR